MLQAKLAAYVLFNVEPDFDSLSGAEALGAIEQAGFVLAMTPYRTAAMEKYADLLLPVSVYAETSGTYVNMVGEWQSVPAAVTQLGDSRPGWKLLRVLGNLFDVPGFEYNSSEDVVNELRSVMGDAKANNDVNWPEPPAPSAAREAGLELVMEMPMHRLDPILRRAMALQKTPDAGDNALRMNPATAQAFGMSSDSTAELRQGGEILQAPVVIDARVPDGAVHVYAGHAFSMKLRAGEAVVVRRIS
jgi:NADH-quinone oxidoreductase subunit G